MKSLPKVICMLTYGYWPVPSGGAENQCRLQSHELSRRGYRCIVLTARISKSLPNHETDSGCEVVRVNVAQPLIDSLLELKTTYFPPKAEVLNSAKAESAQFNDNKKRYAPALAKWLNAAMYIFGASIYLFRHRKVIDIIHTHIASWNAGFAGWIGNILGIPVLCKAAYLPAFYEYNGYVPFPETWRRWRKRIRYIALTPEMADDLAFNGVPREMIHIIPNGVSIPDDIAPVETNRSVLYVGNFTQGVAHKGFDILIDAWARVHQALPWASLVIAGGGDSRHWREMATILGCGDSIRFAGHITDISSCYLQAGLFVLPSRGEGVSNALLEANSFGIPAVASDIPGNREVIVHERTGLLVPVNDSKALAESIVKLLLDDGSRKQMGQAARNRITDQYSIATIVNRVCALYESMTLTRNS